MSTLSVCLFGKFCARHISRPQGVDAHAATVVLLYCWFTVRLRRKNAQYTKESLRAYSVGHYHRAYTKEEHVTRNTLHMAAAGPTA